MRGIVLFVLYRTERLFPRLPIQADPCPAPSPFSSLVYYINCTPSTLMRREARGIESFSFFCFYLDSEQRCEKCIRLFFGPTRAAFCCFLQEISHRTKDGRRTFPHNRFASCRCTERDIFICSIPRNLEKKP